MTAEQSAGARNPVLDRGAFRVSVIVPAYNAQRTLRRTLKSVLKQTWTEWEVVIVDDGSQDRTAAIANEFSRRDPRFRLLAGPRTGVSAARNRGIAAAQHSWLLFLDADDTIHPVMMEKLIHRLATNPTLNAVYCRWKKIGSKREANHRGELPEGDLFRYFADRCVYVIHSCLVPKSLVEEVGAFDTSLTICEDWDLWQRIARTGASFGLVDETLVDYYVRPQVGTDRAFEWWQCASRVLRTGHSEDPRLSRADVKHRMGRSQEQLPEAMLYYACWLSAALPRTEPVAEDLLCSMHKPGNANREAPALANCIFEAQNEAFLSHSGAAHEYWRKAHSRADELCRLLEREGLVPPIRLSILNAWEREVVKTLQPNRPLQIGATYALTINASRPIRHIKPPPKAHRLYCRVSYHGVVLGTIELPICDGFVSRYVVKDAIAAEFAWKILGIYLRHGVYGRLISTVVNGQYTWSRNGIALPTNVGDSNESRFHDEAGWTVFLQELWGRPSWAAQNFYETDTFCAEKTVMGRERRHELEVSDNIHPIEADSAHVNLLITVGGSSVGVLRFTPTSGVISPQTLIARVTTDAGFELCRMAVREAIIGRSARGSTLRSRLAESAKRREKYQEYMKGAPNTHLLPIGRAPLRDVTDRGRSGVLISRYRGPLNTGAARRAHLPIALLEQMLQVSDGQSVMLRFGSPPAKQMVYTPDLIVFDPADEATTVDTAAAPSFNGQRHAESERGYWEGLFAHKRDPWRYGNRYEQTKYEQTLSLVPDEVATALELACAEGFFTQKLAPRVERLVASDISQVALDRASQGCSTSGNVEFRRIDFVHDDLPGDLDLVICSEALYYVGSHEALGHVAGKIERSLKDGGYFLTAHANQVVDNPNEPGFDWGVPFGAVGIGAVFGSTTSFSLQKEIRTPLYRIQLYRKGSHSVVPEVIEESVCLPLPSEVEKLVRWNGSAPIVPLEGPRSVTRFLPILMYHRVSAAGSDELARYRISPDAFEQQIAFLHEAGYYSAGLDEWYSASVSKRPLQGNAVVITFDDGYEDFAEFAWPILKRYGFSALVFLVGKQIGLTNSWDSAEEVPLLTADQIQRLQAEGVHFGSHSHTHSSLLALTPEEVAREYVVSRRVIEEIVGQEIRVISYPFGGSDRVIQHLAGACGYLYGMTTRMARCRFEDSLLALPRLEINGQDSLEDFIAKLTYEN